MRKGGFLITKIHHLSGRLITRKFKGHSIDAINHAQGRILFCLWQHDGISTQELASLTSLNISTLSLMLDRIEAAGHVKRVVSPEDRRKTLIFTTGDHGHLRSQYEQAIQEMEAVFYRGFSEAEIDVAESLLERIYQNLSTEHLKLGSE